MISLAMLTSEILSKLTIDKSNPTSRGDPVYVMVKLVRILFLKIWKFK